MPNPTRTPGLGGRRPPKNAPALSFGRFFTGVLPTVPTADDNLARLSGGWEMLGNDVAGDCVAVTWANLRRLVTTLLTPTGRYPTQSEVWAVSKTQNPTF